MSQARGIATGAQAATGAQGAAAEVIDTSASGSTNCAVVVAAPSDVSEQQQPPRTTLRQLTRLASDDTDSREKRMRQVTIDLVDERQEGCGRMALQQPRRH